MLDALELTETVKRLGYRLEWAKRYQTRYAYAVKGSGKNRVKHYICGEHGLPEMTDEKVEAQIKLQNKR